MDVNQRWINPVEAEIEKIEAAAQRINSERRSALEEETFSGKELDVVTLLDRSFSMNAECGGTLKSKWEIVLENMRAFLQRLLASEELSQTVHLTVMVFSTNVELICEHERVADIDVEALMAKLQEMRPYGVTTLGKSIVKAVQLLDARKDWLREHHRQYYQPILSIMTDGRPTNDAGRYSAESMSQAIHLIDERLENKKITVLPVGIGENEEEFTVLARLIKKDYVEGEEGIPILRNAKDVRRYFRYIGATVSAVARGGSVDINEYTRAFLKYTPMRM